MNELLQKHGCSNVFTIPEGLKELMSDISREVLRDQPPNIYKFIASYLSALLITREHGIMATKILDDLCDCRPSVSEHLMQLGVQHGQAGIISEIIKEEIEKQPEDTTETIKEQQIMKKILNLTPLDEVMAAKVCQVARNAYREYWYRKTILEKSLKMKPEEPWEKAARRTLELYKRTKPSLSELSRATQRIQAAYRGYYVRRNLLQHLKAKQKRRKGPKLDLPGPPIDIAASREIDLGPLTDINVPKDDVHSMFDQGPPDTLSISYEPVTAITHVPEEDHLQELPSLQEQTSKIESRQSRPPSLVASQISESMRQSQLSQPIRTESRKSRIDSQIAPSSTGQKISFAGVPPETIPDEEACEEEEIEVLPPETTEVSEVGDYGEDSGGMQDDMEYVPEDITDHSEYEESIPASLPSSAPLTATTTDVEDEGEMEEVKN